MSTIKEMQKGHEAKLDALLRELGGKSKDSDWALVRALVHKALHFNADRKAREFCVLATLLADQIKHAHELMHGEDKPGEAHADYMH